MTEQAVLAEAFMYKPGDVVPLRSRSRGGVVYEMLVTPEGMAVHIGDGCEGEQFRGVRGCYHSKELEKYTMTNKALVKVESALSPVEIAFNEEQLNLIKRTIAKGVTNDELSLFVATCKRTGLDPFMRQIYAIRRGDTMTIQVGVDGLRLIAQRTGKFGGMDPISWLDEDGQWSEVWTGIGDHPIAARVTVYRTDAPRGFHAAVRWDSYAQNTPTWKKMPDVMLGKCAESLALRRAFPAEMSGMASMIDPDFDYQAEYEEQEASAPSESLPEASSRVLEGEVVQAPPRPTPAPPKPDEDAQPSSNGPVDLLNAIERSQGKAAKVEAIDVMRKMFGTEVVTKLSREDRANFSAILTFRLNKTEHEHEPIYTESQFILCRFCGYDMEPDDEESPDDVDAPESEDGDQPALLG